MVPGGPDCESRLDSELFRPDLFDARAHEALHELTLEEQKGDQ
jgi:hypothetical protein